MSQDSLPDEPWISHVYEDDEDDDFEDYTMNRYLSISGKKMIQNKLVMLRKIIEARDSENSNGLESVADDDEDDDNDGDDGEDDFDMRSFARAVSFCKKKFLSERAEDKEIAGSIMQITKSEDNFERGDKRSVLPKISKGAPMACKRCCDKRTSQWEELMRKFSEAHKEECKTVSLDIPRAPRSAKQFPTGSQYEGTWDVLGMSGFGTYTFPNGVIYSGEFDDGMFQGAGELRYPDGAVLRGKWNKGYMTQRTLTFADGLQYSEDDWKYCKMPDRRFTIEYDNGLQPAGKTYLTADQPTREIPPGYYDTGDGFFDPITNIVYDADELTTIVRAPSEHEQKWIVENCRSSSDKELGPRPDLYEEWSEPQVEPKPPPPPAASSRSYQKSASISEDHDFVFKLEKQNYNTYPDESDSSTSSSTHSHDFNFICN